MLLLLLAAAPVTDPPKAPGAPPAAPPPAGPSAPGTSSPPPAAPPGPAAPPARGPVHEVVLKDLDGKDFPLDRFAGTPMVIEVWSTTCGPCLRQRELMARLAPEYKGKVIFLAASVDKDPAVVRRHVAGKAHAAELLETMATRPLLELIATREKAPTIPKIVYVDSRGRMTDVGTSVQQEAWMRAMLKNLR